ncbi:hypothetical protein [Actinomadura kijaniata]|uniref:hypothetical protein n=1 Tax=Actinomadura kijaniata TaxID=46161 RepID=UPI00082DE04F|nr:hypothetical protein [Actinomadura kijaniata]
MTRTATGQWFGRRLTDDQCRAVALQLDQAHPAWIVWWGPKTRRYWALPARGLTTPVLEHAHPDGLEAAMREVEQWHGIDTRGGAPALPRAVGAGSASPVPAVQPQPRRGSR